MPWTDEAPLLVGFSRQEYWSVLPFPPPADLSDPGIQPASLESSAMVGRCFITAQPLKPLRRHRPPPTHLCPPDLAQCLHTNKCLLSQTGLTPRPPVPCVPGASPPWGDMFCFLHSRDSAAAFAEPSHATVALNEVHR